MKKYELKQGMLLAVLMLGLGSACVSCSDDDKDNKDEKELTPEEQEAKNQAEDLTTMAFWRVAGQLCSGCDETADWQAARLEANIGEPLNEYDAKMFTDEVDEEEGPPGIWELEELAQAVTGIAWERFSAVITS